MGLEILILGLVIFIAAHVFVTCRKARADLIARIGAQDFDDVIATNLGGAFHVCQAASRRMMRRRRGSIVTMSSIVGIHGNAGQTNYGAAKAGIAAFTQICALERHTSSRTDLREQPRVRTKSRVRRYLPVPRSRTIGPSP